LFMPRCLANEPWSLAIFLDRPCSMGPPIAYNQGLLIIRRMILALSETSPLRPGRPYTRAGAGSSWAEEDDEEVMTHCS